MSSCGGYNTNNLNYTEGTATAASSAPNRVSVPENSISKKKKDPKFRLKSQTLGLFSKPSKSKFQNNAKLLVAGRAFSSLSTIVCSNTNANNTQNTNNQNKSLLQKSQNGQNVNVPQIRVDIQDREILAKLEEQNNQIQVDFDNSTYLNSNFEKKRRNFAASAAVVKFVSQGRSSHEERSDKITFRVGSMKKLVTQQTVQYQKQKRSIY